MWSVRALARSLSTMTLAPRAVTARHAQPLVSLVQPIVQRTPVRLPVPLVLERGLKYKLKTKSAVKKRFRQTGSGTFKHMNMGKSHLNTGKDRKKIRRAGKWRMVTSTQEKTLFKLLPGTRTKPKARHLLTRKKYGHPRSKNHKKPPPYMPSKPKGFTVLAAEES